MFSGVHKGTSVHVRCLQLAWMLGFVRDGTCSRTPSPQIPAEPSEVTALQMK